MNLHRYHSEEIWGLKKIIIFFVIEKLFTTAQYHITSVLHAPDQERQRERTRKKNKSVKPYNGYLRSGKHPFGKRGEKIFKINEISRSEIK